MKLKEPKVFTLEEARQTLPFVKRIVADIMDTNQRLAKLDQEIRVIKDSNDRSDKILRRQELRQRHKECQNELDMVGCHLKNAKSGIISYYWDRGNGFIVELCWKYQGEKPDCFYWQEIGGNKLIPVQNSDCCSPDCFNNKEPS